MAISTQYQNLNLIPGKSAPVVVHCSQGNVGDTVGFYLYDGDEPFYPTNVSIAVHGVRADGSVFGPYAVAVTSGSNLVTFELVTAMTSVAGAAIGELVITDSGENQVGSANFGLLVETAPYSSTVTYEDDLSIYQRILAYVQSIPADLQGQITSEVTARQNSNDNLQSQINAETSTRKTLTDSLQSQINAEASTRQNADSNLQSQINQIVAPSGEAPSAAEVQNARIDVEGFTNTSLGEAIRSQVTRLEKYSNLVDAGLTWNVGVMNSDGSINGNSSWRYALVDLKGVKYVQVFGTVNALSNAFAHVAFYKGKTASADTFVSGTLLTDTSKALNIYIPVPENARTMAFANTAANVENCGVKVLDSGLEFIRRSSVLHENLAVNSTGTPVYIEGDVWYMTDYINVKGHSKLYLDFETYKVATDNYTDLAFLDSYGNMIERVIEKTSMHIIPDGAVYAIVTCKAGDDGYYLLDQNSDSIANEIPISSNYFANFEDFQYTVNGITFRKNHDRVYITGTTASNANVKVLPIPLIKAGSKYRISFNSPSDCYLQYFENGTAISTLTSGDVITISNTAVSAFVRLLVNSSTQDSYMDISITRVEAEGTKTVHATTAQELYDFLVNFNGYPTKLVLDAQNYDLYTGLFSNYLAEDSTDFGANEKYLSDVEVVGNGATVSLKIPADLSAAHQASANTISAFNVKGNVHIHDLTIDVENCRYAIHDESLSSEQNYYTNHVYENLTIKYGLANSSVDVNASCVGIGGSLGQVYTFKNCKMYRTGVSGRGMALYIHGRGYNIAELNIENCIFSSVTDTAILLSQYTGNERPVYVNISNSVFDKRIFVKPQTDSGFTVQQWAITSFNSHYSDLVIEDDTTYPLIAQPIIVNSISGTVQ